MPVQSRQFLASLMYFLVLGILTTLLRIECNRFKRFGHKTMSKILKFIYLIMKSIYYTLIFIPNFNTHSLSLILKLRVPNLFPSLPLSKNLYQWCLPGCKPNLPTYKHTNRSSKTEKLASLLPIPQGESVPRMGNSVLTRLG